MWVKFAPYVAGLAVLAAIGFWLDSNGYARCQAEQANAANKALKDQDKAVESHEETKQEIRIVYRDRIKTIREEVDTSGCSDSRAPDGVLDSLRSSD